MRIASALLAFVLIAVAAILLQPNGLVGNAQEKDPKAVPGAATATASSPPAGKEERVGDTPLTLHTSFGTVGVHESINATGRYYVAPRFRFLLVPDSQPKAVARETRAAESGKTPIQMFLEISHPQIRAELVVKMKDIGREVSAADMRNLQVDDIRIGLSSEADYETYGFKDFVLRNPPVEAEAIPISPHVEAHKAKEFVEAVNNGKINFSITYSYNKISLDSRFESLKLSSVMSTATARDLTMRGAEFVSARQMAEAAKEMQKEITSTVYLGLGKIDAESLPIDTIVKQFRVDDIWRLSEKDLAEMDARIQKQFDLRIDTKDFQPFRFQKKVLETLNKETTVAGKKKAYADLYKDNKTSMSASASVKYAPVKGEGKFSKEFQEKMNKGEMTDDDFLEHVKDYHGVEYSKEEVLGRGIELYDIQKIKYQGDVTVKTVTVKPTIGTGTKTLPIATSAAEATRTDLSRANNSRLAIKRFVFSSFEGWDDTTMKEWMKIVNMGAQKSDRIFSRSIKFDRPYAVPPTVLPMITGFDIPRTRAVVICHPENVTREGFNLVLKTWDTTGIDRVETAYIILSND